MMGFFSTTSGGQYAFLILRFTSSALSSMKMAESGSLLDIFSWPSLRPLSMWCEMITGLKRFFLSPAYSLRKTNKKTRSDHMCVT